MRPEASLAADATPRHLEHRPHGYPNGPTIEGVAARGAHQDAVDIECGGGTKIRADVGVVHNALENAHAHRALAGCVAEALEKRRRIHKRRATERGERAARPTSRNEMRGFYRKNVSLRRL